MSSGTSNPNDNDSFSTSIFSDEKKIEMFDKMQVCTLIKTLVQQQKLILKS